MSENSDIANVHKFRRKIQNFENQTQLTFLFAPTILKKLSDIFTRYFFTGV